MVYRGIDDDDDDGDINVTVIIIMIIETRLSIARWSITQKDDDHLLSWYVFFVVCLKNLRLWWNRMTSLSSLLLLSLIRLSSEAKQIKYNGMQYNTSLL